MMKENEQVPDIEKLEHHDFDLDVEEQTRLQEEGDREVARVSGDSLTGGGRQGGRSGEWRLAYRRRETGR